MIIANWKMNGSKDSIDSWLRLVSSNIEYDAENPCIFCPPSCFLDYSSSLIKEISSSVRLGSQTIISCLNERVEGWSGSDVPCRKCWTQWGGDGLGFVTSYDPSG